MVTLLAISSTQNAMQDVVKDPAAVFVLLLSFGLIGLVLWVGRSPKDPGGPTDPNGPTGQN